MNLTHMLSLMNLEHMMLSKISKTHKDKYSKIPLIRHLEVVRFVETESRMMAVRGWGRGETGSYCQWVTSAIRDVKKLRRWIAGT